VIDAWIAFAALAVALVLFVGGWWRYDVVALLVLTCLTVVGIVPEEKAFVGFGHPAVITVAAVLVVSRGLIHAGIIHPIAAWLGRVGDRPLAEIGGLTALVTVCSAFMNNIGALALLMPVAIAMARRSGRSPSMSLMPLAFGSILGGLVTLIGTPPNIIIATYRRDVAGEPFSMFDFTPVGGMVALMGVLFIVLVGWRLIPKRRPAASADDLFDISDYLVELRVPEGAPVIGQTLTDLGRFLSEGRSNEEGEANGAASIETVVVGLYRDERRILAPPHFETLRAGDILTIEIDPDRLGALVERTGLTLASEGDGETPELSTGEIKLVEAVVSPRSTMLDRTVEDLQLRWRHGLNLLAVARQGARITTPLRAMRFRAGDILLLQGNADSLPEALASLGCLPLADRELELGRSGRALPAVAIFAVAIASTALGWLPVQIAFGSAALLMVMTNLVPLRDAYEAVDWPVIVLLAAMIPVGEAMETTGGARLIADGMLAVGRSMPPWAMVLSLMATTLALSNLINNAAAAVLMAPIGIELAARLEASPDPLLMAIAVGASCAFLTPIGHQSNTLVLGPGGYHFADYWPMGLPLSLVSLAVATPMILWAWPIHP
jgi:di/tricarboxylate transporter